LLNETKVSFTPDELRRQVLSHSLIFVCSSSETLVLGG
jgi:hypothetical protein